MDASDASDQPSAHAHAGVPAHLLAVEITRSPWLVVEWILLWAMFGMYERVEPTGVNPAELASLAFADCLGLLPPGHVPSVEVRLFAASLELPWLRAVYRRGAMAITVVNVYWAMCKELDR